MPYKTRAQKQNAQEKRLVQTSSIDYPQDFIPAPKETGSTEPIYVSSNTHSQSEVTTIVKDLRKILIVSVAILLAQVALYLTL